MIVELTRSYVVYQAQSKLLELATEIAETKNLSKVKDKIILATKIRLWLKALQYYTYLDKPAIDRLVYVLADLCDANALPYSPQITTVEPPTLLVGIPGARGEQGVQGEEGGGVPFSATSVTTDTIVDSFPVTDSRGVDYTINIYDDAGGDMRIMRLQAGWNADGSSYSDDGGTGETIVGDTSGVSMSVIVSGSTVQLFATVTSGEWTIEGTRKYVPNNGNGIVNPTTLASGKIWIGSSSNNPVSQTISGDITISNTGVASITSGSVINADISSTAAIDTTKFEALTASKAVVTDGSGFMTTSATTATEIGFLAGVSSSVQDQLDSKIGSASGAISTVVNTNLTSDRLVISNPSGKIAVLGVTSTEASYLSGATSSLQTQINSRVADTGDTMTGALVNTSTIEAQGGIRTASSGVYLKEKLLDIGTWNMSASSSVQVAHGISSGVAKIKHVEVKIYNDLGSSAYDFSSSQLLGVDVNSGVTWSDTNIGLSINLSSSFFATATFDSTASSRGEILVTYEA